MIKAVIFDLGGVLVRTEFPEVRQRLEKQLGLDSGVLGEIVWGGEAWTLAESGQISYEEYWRRVGVALGLNTDEEIRSFRREYFSGDRLDQDLVSLIEELRTRYKIGLLSNAPDRLDQWLAEEWGIRELFDAIVYSGKVRLVKPHPGIFRMILEELAVAPGEALFIDDYPRNIDAALELGMHAIRFTSTKALKQELGRYVTLDTGDTEH